MWQSFFFLSCAQRWSEWSTSQGIEKWLRFPYPLWFRLRVSTITNSFQLNPCQCSGILLFVWCYLVIFSDLSEINVDRNYLLVLFVETGSSEWSQNGIASLLQSATRCKWEKFPVALLDWRRKIPVSSFSDWPYLLHWTLKVHQILFCLRLRLHAAEWCACRNNCPSVLKFQIPVDPMRGITGQEEPRMHAWLLP